MITIGYIGLCLGLIALMLRIRYNGELNSFVHELFAHSKCAAEETFLKRQLELLPEPMQRCFSYATREGQPVIQFARIKNEEPFITGIDQSAVNLMRDQSPATSVLEFVWRDSTERYTANDRYLIHKGSRMDSLFHMLKVIQAKGKKQDQKKLLRWLEENEKHPSNQRSKSKQQAFLMEDVEANLSYNGDGLSLSCIVSVHELNKIIGMKSPQLMDAHNLETWVVRVSNDVEWNNSYMPTCIEVFWKIQKGDFCYAKLNVTPVEYDVPLRFRNIEGSLK